MTDQSSREVDAADRQLMGAPEAARDALIAKAREWRELRQPSIATAKAHKERDRREHQVRFEIANAVLLWLWHEENPLAAAQARAPGDGHTHLNEMRFGPEPYDEHAPKEVARRAQIVRSILSDAENAMAMDQQQTFNWLVEEKAKLEARVAELEARPVPPEGYKLVPLDPTEEQHNAGERAWRNRNLHDKNSNPLDDCYRAMLAASPSPPAAGKEDGEPDSDGWSRVGAGTPLNVTLETRREGESGTNRCFCRIASIGDALEWCETAREDHNDRPFAGRTTVTHSTFLAPTHWRWPLPAPPQHGDGT